MTLRAIFLHYDRVADLVLTLKFDRFLNPTPSQTVIFVGPQDLDFDLLELLKSQDIDTDTFCVIQDRQMWNCNQPPVNIYQFGGWISQQFLKLLALDYLDYDCMLIQDCDTFCIRPYTWLENDTPQMLVRINSTHSPEYYDYVEQFTGSVRQTPHSLVSEFMPVLKADWEQFKQQLYNRFQQPWYQVLYDQFLVDSQGTDQIWFSEYELLGNWALLQHPDIKLIEQKRFELYQGVENRLEKLSECNCVCNYKSVDLAAIGGFEQALLDNMHS
jgi:hypothetical protein